MQFVAAGPHPTFRFIISRYSAERFFDLIWMALQEQALTLAPADTPEALLFAWDDELVALRPGLVYQALRAWKPLACSGLSVGTIRTSMTTFGLLRCVLHRRVAATPGGRRKLQTLWIVRQDDLFTDSPRHQDIFVLYERPAEPRCYFRIVRESCVEVE